MQAVMLGALALLLVAPTALADVDVEDALATDCAEPCGYIVPIINLDFPEKQTCGGSGLIFTGEEERDCAGLPALGETVRLDGTLTWYYDASEEPPYPKQVGEDIVITFGGTRNNPGWLEMAVEPGEFRITDQDLVNPVYFETEGDPQTGTVLWYRYVQDLSVTFTRTGDPSAADLARIEDRDGILQVFLKAKSTESSQTYRESFGVEEFRFMATQGPGAVESPNAAANNNEAPGVAVPLLAVGALGAAVLARRRA